MPGYRENLGQCVCADVRAEDSSEHGCVLECDPPLSSDALFSFLFFFLLWRSLCSAVKVFRWNQSSDLLPTVHVQSVLRVHC